MIPIMKIVNKPLKYKPVRFLISGGSAAITEYTLFLLLVAFLPSHPIFLIAAQSLSFGGGLIVSFLLNRSWVFESTAKESKKMFTKYLLLALINLFITNILIILLEPVLPLYIAKFVVMLMIASWNFIIFKTLIFR